MEIVNDGLSEEIFEFLKQDWYDHEKVKGKLSITTLLKPVQQLILTLRHDDEIVLKASDLFYRVFGSAVHAALESLRLSDVIQERRYDAPLNGFTVTGKPDLLRLIGGGIVDYKTASVWKYVRQDWADYEEQLNGYRWLLEKNGIKTSDDSKIVMIMRDFREGEKPKIKGYPPLPIMDIPFKLRPVAETEKMLSARLAALLACDTTPDDKLPECTMEEMWYQPRTGAYTRCERYCSVCDFCHQLKRRESSKKEA